jgi:hypothetical protein
MSRAPPRPGPPALESTAEAQHDHPSPSSDDNPSGFLAGRKVLEHITLLKLYV